MKKLLVLIIMIVGFTVSVVGAAPLDYDFTITDNYTFDLESGVYSYDENYITTNRIKILDEEVGISTDTFHHVLFFGNNNEYIGYKNTTYSNIINEKYLGVVSGGSFTVPENATTFTLLSYKEANEAIIPEYGLSLNDIFGETLFTTGNTNNLIENGAFSDGTNGWTLRSNTNLIIENGRGKIIATASGTWIGISQTVVNNENNSLYLSFDMENVSSLSYIYMDDNQVFDMLDNDLKHFSHIYNASNDDNFRVMQYSLNLNEYVYFDNIILLDLTTIFGETVPNQSTMDELLYQYKLNKDLNNAYAVDDISYKDIFGESIYGTEGTNLIENGDFSDDLSNWLFSTQNTSNFIEWRNGRAYLESLDLITYISQHAPSYAEHIYYYTYDIEIIEGNFRVYTQDIAREFIYDTGVYSYLSSRTLDSAYNLFFIKRNLSISKGYIDNIQVYDFTTTFGETVPSIATFEGYRDTFEANIVLNNEYTNYFTVASFSLIQPTYDYITPEADDTISTPDDMLDTVIDTVGGDSTLSQVIISITIMLVILVILASANANYLFIVGIEMVVYSALSILGWVPAWVNIIFGVILLLILVRTFTGKSGGQSDDNL